MVHNHLTKQLLDLYYDRELVGDTVFRKSAYKIPFLDMEG